MSERFAIFNVKSNIALRCPLYHVFTPRELFVNYFSFKFFEDFVQCVLITFSPPPNCPRTISHSWLTQHCDYFSPHLLSPIWVAYMFFYVQPSTEVCSTYQGQQSLRTSSLSQQVSIANPQLGVGLHVHQFGITWVCVGLVYAVTITVSSHMQLPCVQMAMFPRSHP